MLREFYWFGKTSPLITGQNQPAAADTVAGNSKHPALSHLPSLSLSHLPSRVSSRERKSKHAGDWACEREAARFRLEVVHFGLKRVTQVRRCHQERLDENTDQRF